jgi:hypothetical protein
MHSPTLSLNLVISTEAYPDFLLRGAIRGRVCGFLRRKAA